MERVEREELGHDVPAINNCSSGQALAEGQAKEEKTPGMRRILAKFLADLSRHLAAHAEEVLLLTFKVLFTI